MNRLYRGRGALIVLFTSLLGACSSSAPLAPHNITPPSGRTPIIELFLSRSSMTMTEFEQYKLSSGHLYMECGEVRRGRFIAREQELTPVTNDALAPLHERIADLFASASRTDSTMETPGTNRSLLDPGIFLLSIELEGSGTKNFKTSLDSVANAEQLLTQSLRKLASLIRGLRSEIPCGNDSFYGIPRSDP